MDAKIAPGECFPKMTPKRLGVKTRALLIFKWIEGGGILKLPTHVKIGGLTYTVRTEPNLAVSRRVFGEMHPVTQEIAIADNLTKDQQGETLLHEIIEAIANNCDLGLEHFQIQVLGFVLYQVLKDNQLRFE